jgi:Histidinol dehydrogenase
MIIKNIIYNDKNFFNQLKKFLEKRKIDQNQNSSIVKKIIIDVKKDKDNAILKYEKKFNKNSQIKISGFKYSNNEIKKLIKNLDNRTKKSIDISFNRIKKFHSKQILKTFSFRDNHNIKLSYRSSPIDRVGVYVPGGTANYPSTVLMNCIPALVAGVKNIYLTTPTDKKNTNPAVIYAATKCGVKEIYKIGGAQAIAAFAFGTKKFCKLIRL